MDLDILQGLQIDIWAFNFLQTDFQLSLHPILGAKIIFVGLPGLAVCSW